MAKRKTLPKDFEQLVQTASDEDIKKVLGKCDINAYGGYNKGNALEVRQGAHPPSHAVRTVCEFISAL